jgi:hypothetical protein
MGDLNAQAELRNQAGVEKFFTGRDALIAQERERRSGTCLLFTVHIPHRLR